MAVSYPLNAAPELVARHARHMPRVAQGFQESSFTYQGQVQDFGGAAWVLEVDLPPMKADDARPLIGWGMSLNGRVGSFLMEPPDNPGVAGSWTGAPLVKGAHAAGARSLLVDGFTGSVEANDYFSLGSGASTHLHMVTQSGVVGSPTEILLEIWPPLRAAVADNDALTIVQPKGLWRLTGPVGWEKSPGGIYVVEIPPIIEYL